MQARQTILLIEDEALLRIIIRETLEAAGYNCLVAAHGIAAIAEFDSHPEIELVITDLNLPGIKGEEIFNTLLERRAGIRVIVSTGATDSAAYASLLERGAHLLRKPFMPQDLLTAVRSALAT